MILYTYFPADTEAANRWEDTDIPDEFYADLDEVKKAVLEIREEVTRLDPENADAARPRPPPPHTPSAPADCRA